MVNRLKSIWQSLLSQQSSKTFGLLALLLLFAAIPLTVYVAQQQQEIRQRAQECQDDQGNPIDCPEQPTQPPEEPTQPPDSQPSSPPERHECDADEDCPSGQYCDKRPDLFKCFPQGKVPGSDSKRRSEGSDDRKQLSSAKPTKPPKDQCKVKTGKPAGCKCKKDNQCASQSCVKSQGDDDEKACAGPTPTPTPDGPTATPTPTGIGEPTATPTPGGGDGVTLFAGVKLDGIGGTPQTTERPLTITLFDVTSTKVAEQTGKITFNPQTGLFEGGIDLGVVAQGPYLVKVKTVGYLTKLVDGILLVREANRTYSFSTTPTLLPGDINDDNQIDILDYNILVSCFEEKADTQTCSGNKQISDLNDDGRVDGVDVNIFVRNLQTQQGD